MALSILMSMSIDFEPETVKEWLREAISNAETERTTAHAQVYCKHICILGANACHKSTNAVLIYPMTLAMLSLRCKFYFTICAYPKALADYIEKIKSCSNPALRARLQEECGDIINRAESLVRLLNHFHDAAHKVMVNRGT